jgi:hypothetical protein
MLLRLRAMTQGSATGDVAFYSGAAGAFIDLADDARWIFNLDGYPALDEHLRLPNGPARKTGLAGLADFRDINQAIGCLIEDGHPPDLAKHELRRQAARDGHSLAKTARRILRPISRDPNVITDPDPA